MVFMSLLLGAELGTLVNSAAITTGIRLALKNQEHFTLRFWTGMMIVISIICTLFSLITTFTAWGMVSAVSNENAHCIMRSSVSIDDQKLRFHRLTISALTNLFIFFQIGQYVAELPGRFIVSSIYSFLIWFMLFIFLLFPFGIWSVLLVLGVIFMFIHVMIVFSVFGRLIMHTGCMGKDRIFDEQFEKGLLPRTLQHNLYIKAKAELENKTSIRRQYRRTLNPLTHDMDLDDMSTLLRQMGSSPEVSSEYPRRNRSNSNVRFADTLWESADARDVAVAPTTNQVGTLASTTIPNKPFRSNLTKLRKISSSSIQSNSSAASQISVEEWLQAGTAKQPHLSTNVESHHENNLLGSYGEDSEDDDKKDEENQFSSEECLPEVPPMSISTFRMESVVSSVGDDLVFDGGYQPNLPLTADEKFDLEYGELFHPAEQFGPGRVKLSASMDLTEQSEEQYPLLTSDISQRNSTNYGASTTVVNGNEILRPALKPKTQAGPIQTEVAIYRAKSKG
jgi:hypothetical protein